MGNFVFILPDIGEGVVEGEIVQWHVSVGDSVAEDDPIVDVMTDKATVTIPSPVSGIVDSLSGGVGDMIAVGSTLLEINSEGSEIQVPIENESDKIELESGDSSDSAGITTSGLTGKDEPREYHKPEKVIPKKEPVPSAPVKNPSSRILASPAVRANRVWRCAPSTSFDCPQWCLFHRYAPACGRVAPAANAAGYWWRSAGGIRKSRSPARGYSSRGKTAPNLQA